MIVYSEGNNFRYLNKAKSFLKPDLHVKFYDGGGKNNLEYLFKMFVNNNHDEKTLVLFDCDAVIEYKRCKSKETKYIKIQIFPKNEKNTKYHVGIENLFNDELILESKAYSITVTDDRKFGQFSIPNFNKFKFCDFICEERNNKDDFENFSSTFNEIEAFINE
jgi:hypothetical protein